MRAAAIRQELLTGKDEDLEKRRTIATLSAIGLVDFAIILSINRG